MADYDLKAISPDTTPQDSNVVFGADDQSSATPKPFTFAGIKAWAKAYFDGIYAQLSHNHSASEITLGTLPLIRGGTNGTTASGARDGIGAFGARKVTVFSSSGTFVPDNKAVWTVIECQAGGGQGGGGSASAGTVSGGGGGGAGEYSVLEASPATIAAGSKAISIGAGGSGSTGATTGGNGGNTTYGSTMCTAIGGSGGQAGTSGGIGAGGAGGSGGTATWAVRGEFGAPSNYATATTASCNPGKGGSSEFGRGAQGPTVSFGSTANGTAGLGFGSGGSGGGAQGSASAGNGGNGAPGYVKITEYLSS